MGKDALAAICKLTCDRVGRQSEFLSSLLWTGAHDPKWAPPSEMEEHSLFDGAFSEECRPQVELLLAASLRELRRLPFEKSSDVLVGLEILQELVAAAMWKHHCRVGETLEAFAREFDILDTNEEKVRLHLESQA